MNPCWICLSAIVLVATMQTTDAQQVRLIQRSDSPDQWSISFSRKGNPDKFEFDSVQSSQDAAKDRVAALRAWSVHRQVVDAPLKVATILVEVETRKADPGPGALAANPAADTKSSDDASAAKPTTMAPPAYSRFLKETDAEDQFDIPKLAGRRGQGTLGTAAVIIEFDGDGSLQIKDTDNKPLNTGTWSQSGSELSFATERFLYIGNVGSEKARGVRVPNGVRLGTEEEDWNLSLSIVDPLVGTWHLTTQNGDKTPGQLLQTYSTTLVLRNDHTAIVDWVTTTTRVGSNIPERITDYDRSTANWQVRDGKIYFSNPKVIKNWRGHDNQLSWFNPKYPLRVETLKSWNRVR